MVNSNSKSRSNVSLKSLAPDPTNAYYCSDCRSLSRLRFGTRCFITECGFESLSFRFGVGFKFVCVSSTARDNASSSKREQANHSTTARGWDDDTHTAADDRT